jgi:glycosyltransferase involved in cell wall biosynthesis
VTLFATADSETKARLVSVAPQGYEEDRHLCAKVYECLHISEAFERADQFDLIHNHFDFLPLTYSRLIKTPVITTIHGFSSPRILPVFEKYNGHVSYVAISDADRSPALDYVATIHHGIEVDSFTFRPKPDDYLLFFGRIHPDKGAKEAIEIARRAGRHLLLAGIVQDPAYFRAEVEPHLDGERVKFLGSVGPDERDRLLGGAYALLHPISFAEPFGLSVVEAMACGTPVIAFSRGSMPELIEHGSNGFLVRDVEAARAAVEAIPTLDRLVCRRHAERRFTVERMVDDYLRVYQTVRSRTSAEPAAPNRPPPQ